MKHTLLGYALASAAALALSLSAAHADTTELDASAEFVPGQIIVKFTPGAARSQIAEEKRARPKEELRAERTWILEVEPGDELDAVARFRNNPNIEFAEPNYIYQIIPCATGDCEAPSDLLFGAKWDLHNPGHVKNTAGDLVAYTGAKGADIAWLEAYEYLQNSGITSQGAVLGVIDTGIRATHQDLAGKVIGGRNFCPSLLCLLGSVNANNWADDNGHGTHVASTAAAHGNNGLGTPGVAFMEDAKLLAIRVCGGPLGLCNAAGISNGIIWAVDNGAHVLNLSLGGGAPSAATQNALQYALDNNVLPVCASGNDGTNTVSFPAAFPQCMAVGSSNWSDERSSYSNAGPEIEVAAPGGDLSDAQPHSLILAAYHTNDTAYAYLAGTSMATPQVAGLATLLRATGMNSAADIRDRIRQSADDRGEPGFDIAFGDGRINVYRALTQMDPFIEFQNSHRSSLNLGANGLVQVVLSAQQAETFSLDQVQIDSILLNGVPLALRNNGTPHATWSEGNLVLHFSIPALRGANALHLGANTTTLSATLDDGRRLRAFTTVNVH